MNARFLPSTVCIFTHYQNQETGLPQGGVRMTRLYWLPRSQRDSTLFGCFEYTSPKSFEATLPIFSIWFFLFSSKFFFPDFFGVFWIKGPKALEVGEWFWLKSVWWSLGERMWRCFPPKVNLYWADSDDFLPICWGFFADSWSTLQGTSTYPTFGKGKSSSKYFKI